MRTLQVQFTSGREVLGHYWGLLSGGGLAIDLTGIEHLSDGASRAVRECAAGQHPDGEEPCPAPCSAAADEEAEAEAVADLLSMGEIIRLEVHVCSVRKTYPLDVRVVELRRGKAGLQLIVAFLHSLPPDELLDAAWADGCDAPQRRSRRLPLQTKVHYERLDGTQMERRVGQLLNLSVGGCCVEGAALPPPGTQVLLTTVPHTAAAGPPLKLVGKVRWTEKPSGGLMGIEFLRPAPEVLSLLQTLGLLPASEDK